MTEQDTISQRLEAALIATKAAELQASKATNLVETRTATEIIEQTAIDVVSVFEARMQHHFKRGPFFKELHKRLNANDAPELATRVIQYYHAVNVLKHGHGKSHRELLAMKRLPFKVRQHDRNDSNIGLVDVLSPGFSDGLIETLQHAQGFLET